MLSKRAVRGEIRQLMLICKCQKHVSFLIKQQQARKKADGCKLHVVDVGWCRTSRPRCQLFGCFWLRHIMMAMGGHRPPVSASGAPCQGAAAHLVPQSHRHSVSRLSFLRSAQITESAESVSADALQQQQAWDDYYNQPWLLSPSPSENRKMNPICNLKVQLLVSCM